MTDTIDDVAAAVQRSRLGRRWMNRVSPSSW